DRLPVEAVPRRVLAQLPRKLADFRDPKPLEYGHDGQRKSVAHMPTAAKTSTVDKPPTNDCRISNTNPSRLSEIQYPLAPVAPRIAAASRISSELISRADFGAAI